MKEVYRTIKHGHLTVENVPHLYKNGELFPDGNDVIVDGAVFHTLTKIFEYMIAKGISQSNYAVIKNSIT